jgi:HSP20 family protein
MATQEVQKAAEAEKPAEAQKSRALTFPDIREEMDRLWMSVLSNSWRPFRFAEPLALIPTMDVFEKDGHLEVRVELPGIDAKDVDVTVNGSTLSITGEKKEEKETKESTFHRTERTYGKFSRQITLPANAHSTKATAKFNNGVLEVKIPVDGESDGGKKIEIQA